MLIKFGVKLSFMKFIAIIPARYSSSRFPGKPLAQICGKPMIQRVYENVVICKDVSEIYVATDDERIYQAVVNFGGKAIMTSASHSCGTDRLAECARKLNLSDDDVILNIQGDEPLIRPEMVQDLISIFYDHSVYMGTLKKEITLNEEIENSNVVKVITDVNNDALYFSRYSIPFVRNEGIIKKYKHIGVYGYTKQFLLKFSGMNKTPLEQTESLEQLRVLENGFKIRVKETKYQTIGVDTKEQLKQVEKYIEENGLS